MRVTLTNELTARGYDKNDIVRLTRAGTLRHLRRGAYTYIDATQAAAEGSAELSVIAGHRELIEATVPQLSGQT